MGLPTQGVALGYAIAPRWGLPRVHTEAQKQRKSNLPPNGRHTPTEVKSRHTGLSKTSVRIGDSHSGEAPQGEEIR